MKKLLLLGIVVALGLFAAMPLIALNNIKTGIETNDARLLSEHVDFPHVREGLKAQVKAYIKAKLEKERASNPFAAFGMSLANNLADGIVDTYVTPAGLADLMRGRAEANEIRNQVSEDDFGEGVAGEGVAGEGSVVQAETKSPAKTGKVVNEIPAETFENASFSYTSFNDFKVDITNDDGRITTLLLSRDGLMWRLSSIVLPLKT